MTSRAFKAQDGGEFAIRAALGAGRTRLIQQILTESLLLAMLGGAVGMMVAPLGIEALKALSPGLPRAGAIGVDGTVFTFALSMTTLIGLAVGLIPALHTSRGELYDEESLAKRKFPNQDPIGQRVHVGPPGIPWFTIVGVVGDVKQASLAVSQTDAVYTTPMQWSFRDNAMSLVVRAHIDAAALAPALRQAIRSVDKDQPIVRVATMDSLLATTAAERRFALILS